jgi:hypothetical protein
VLFARRSHPIGRGRGVGSARCNTRIPLINVYESFASSYLTDD